MNELGALDLLTALLTGAISLLLFTIHVITSKRHHQWITLPEYVRAGILATGLVFMLRSVNLLSLAHESEVLPGHVNYEGLLVAGVLFYTVAAVAYWLYNAFRQRTTDTDLVEVVADKNGVRAVHLHRHTEGPTAR